MRPVATLSVLGAVPAALGGLIFRGVHGGVPLTRSIAYGFWFAAAVCVLLMAVTGSKRVWRSLPVAAWEGWVFMSAAVVLTVVGALVDALGA